VFIPDHCCRLDEMIKLMERFHIDKDDGRGAYEERKSECFR